MHTLALNRSFLIANLVALLVGCGESQPPIGASGAVPQAATGTHANRGTSCFDCAQHDITALSATSAERVHVRHAFSVVYRFKGASGDGELPYAGLLNIKGTLYGTTQQGGTNGDGTVFSITPSGMETVLYSFKGGSGDGVEPLAGLTNVKGTLYGTTSLGGANKKGTVFSITPSGKETVLQTFGGSGGENPAAPLLNVNGTFYGTTAHGGANNDGTAFAITPSGTETVIHSFGGLGDGIEPDAGLLNVKGTLYGTTYGGGHYSAGTVFSITPSGTETVLYSFGAGGSADGAYPFASVINVNGTLYGTTAYGGASSRRVGTVFSITPSGTETVLYSFKGSSHRDGAHPWAALIDVKGTLYGTTINGGVGARGTVFSITPSGTETVLHIFKGGPKDGAYPIAGLLNVNSKLYGTTFGGGSGSCYSEYGCGTAFSLSL
jgi:uncharacterized repeat protein (TIGR03803 family)